MNPNWYYAKVGQPEQGPFTSAQLKVLALNGQLIATDKVRREDMTDGIFARQIKGLFPPPAVPVPPPVPAPTPESPVRAAVEQVAFGAAPAFPPLPPLPVEDAQVVEALPLPDEDVEVVEALPVPDDEGPTAPEQVKASAPPALPPAARPVARAVAVPAPPAAEAPKARPTARPVASAALAAVAPPPPQEMPPLTSRPTAAQHRDTGELVPLEFGCCWNDLEKADLKGEELLYFCATKTRLAGSVGSKVMGLFSGKAAPQPVYHLAVFRGEVVLLHFGPENRPVPAVRLPIDTLTWRLVPAVESGAGIMSLFKKPTAEEQADRARTVNLTIAGGGAEHQLQLFQTRAIDELKQLLVKLVLERAEARVAEGRYHQAEQILDRFPPDSDVAPAATALREKIGTAARIEADYQGGHPEIAGPVRGTLRFDALGVEFFVAETDASWRLPYSRVVKLYEPRPGRFPPEYVRSVEVTRKAALAGIVTAKLARRSGNMVVSLGAEAGLIAAKSKLASTKVGPPFHNRLVLIVRADDGSRVKLVFDIAGNRRQEVEQQTVTFYASVAAVADRFAPAEPSEPPQPARRAKIVGCPKCQVKLRAARPGVVQCPRCMAKVRVQESQFYA